MAQNQIPKKLKLSGRRKWGRSTNVKGQIKN